MKENDFITWFSAQTLNLQGYVLIVNDKKNSKDDYSSISIECTFENDIWRIMKKGPEEILTAANYKDKSIIGNDEYKKQIVKLQLILSDDDLIDSLSRMKKKGIKKSLEHISRINDILEKINLPYRGIAIENADQIYDLCRYYSQPELIVSCPK